MPYGCSHATNACRPSGDRHGFRVRARCFTCNRASVGTCHAPACRCGVTRRGHGSFHSFDSSSQNPASSAFPEHGSTRYDANGTGRHTGDGRCDRRRPNPNAHGYRRADAHGRRGCCGNARQRCVTGCNRDPGAQARADP